MGTKIIENKNGTKMIAHRGLSGLETENTCAAFVAAGNRSYYGIECDLHETADGKIVVVHDYETGRVADVNLPIEETKFDILRAVVLNDRFSQKKRFDLRIPTLEEYIKICEHYDKKAIIELKGKLTKNSVYKICDYLKAEGHLDRVVFISFDMNLLLYMREKLPEQPAQFLTSGELTDGLIQKLKDLKLDLDIYYVRLNKERIDACHAAGIKVNCWTLDRPEVAEEFISYGIDFITTNILE